MNESVILLFEMILPFKQIKFYVKLNILCRDASVTTSIWMEASVVIAVVLLGFGFCVLNFLSILSDSFSPEKLTEK